MQRKFVELFSIFFYFNGKISKAKWIKAQFNRQIRNIVRCYIA